MHRLASALGHAAAAGPAAGSIRATQVQRRPAGRGARRRAGRMATAKIHTTGVASLQLSFVHPGAIK